MIYLRWMDTILRTRILIGMSPERFVMIAFYRLPASLPGTHSSWQSKNRFFWYLLCKILQRHAKLLQSLGVRAGDLKISETIEKCTPLRFTSDSIGLIEVIAIIWISRQELAAATF